MKTIALFALTTMLLTACASADRRARPTITPTTGNIGTPGNWHGSTVTSPSM